MPISFAAIDVETANADLASICQIGIVIFSDGKVVDHLQFLIDPEDEFDAINVSIHGIDGTTVIGAPRFCDIASTVAKMIGDESWRVIWPSTGWPCPAPTKNTS